MMNSSQANKIISERLAISSGCFKNPSLEDWEKVKKAGFHKVEISPPTTHFGARLYWENMKKIAEDLTTVGLELWSLHIPFGHIWDPSSVDEELRASTSERTRQMMEMAARLGAKGIVVHTCGREEPVPREESLTAFRRTLAELTEEAKKLGIFVAVENLPRQCLGNRSDELESLLNPDSGVCFDVNHLLQESHSDFVKRLGHRIKTVHLSDYDFIDERHWSPGKGKIQWAELMELLEQCGYTGPMLFEVSPGPSPEELVQNFHEAITRAY